MLRRTLIVLSVCSLVALITIGKWYPQQAAGMQWTTARRPPLQGPVQGDWFTDMSDAMEWAEQVEPRCNYDLGIFVYQSEPVITVAGPAQPAVVASVRHAILVPAARLKWMLCIVPASLMMLSLARWRRARVLERRERNGLCPTCGYDLRASPQRCPECGYAISSAKGSERDGEPARPRAGKCPA